MQIKCDLTSICGVTRWARARAPTSVLALYVPASIFQRQRLLSSSDLTLLWLLPLCSYSNMDPTKTRTGAPRLPLPPPHNRQHPSNHGKTRWGSINFRTMKFICPFPVPSVQLSLMAGHRGTQRKASKTQRGYTEAPGQGWRGAERGLIRCWEMKPQRSNVDPNQTPRSAAL